MAIIPVSATAACNFQTALHAAEMQRLDSVRLVDVRVNKYRKWVANAAAIVSDGKPVIDKRYKKKFGARIVVYYPFGYCRYRAVVRQNGDWKDHISWNGFFTQSLDVKLEDGNVAGAVRFKLLMPATRGGDNEVFATQLLRRLGFLAPKTAILNARVNGQRGLYLFQEKQAKELLEGLGRREGPLFEGDEALEWTNGERTINDAVSASRLVNSKWAGRGTSSVAMSTWAFSRLQEFYLSYGLNAANGKTEFGFLDGRAAAQQAYYETIVYSMNGEHAMALHNRKYYWNALAQEFESIYYDGNTYFAPMSDDTLRSEVWNYHPQQFFLRSKRAVDFHLVADQIDDFNSSDQIERFSALALVSHKKANSIFERNMRHMKHNLKMLEKWTAESEPLKPTPSYHDIRERYIAEIGVRNLNQIVLAPAAGEDDVSDGFDIVCLTAGPCPATRLDLAQLVDLMSNNRIGDLRAVLIARTDEDRRVVKVTQAGSVAVRHAHGAVVEFDAAENHLRLRQSKPDDWFFIGQTDLGDIAITLHGLPPDPDAPPPEQRFNAMGLTGCLTLYDVDLNGATISASDGGCEDSVNIVTGRGSVATLSVERSFADAIDMDFTDISIDHVAVQQAGNDCLDVSGGNYRVAVARLTGCQDKGLSVGEASQFTGSDVQVSDALIAVSSKDWSQTLIEDLTAKATPICAEAYQKKAEFGGGSFRAVRADCGAEAAIRKDAMSVISIPGALRELSN